MSEQLFVNPAGDTPRNIALAINELIKVKRQNSIGAASSTDNAIARFDGTDGKQLQNSGATIDDSGNIAANNFSGTFSGTHSGTSSGTNTGDQTITLTGHVTGSGTGSFATTIQPGVVTEAMQVLADNTTHDVSITKHGYVPKAPNDADKFLNGLGAWATVETDVQWVPLVTGASGPVLVDDGEGGLVFVQEDFS